jgi:hypothetical protein
MGNVKTFIPDIPPNLMDNPTDNYLMDDITLDLYMSPDPAIPNLRQVPDKYLQPPSPRKRGPRTNSDRRNQHQHGELGWSVASRKVQKETEFSLVLKVIQ